MRYLRFLFLIVWLASPAMAEVYTSNCEGVMSFTYDADPNGVFPDESGYGDFVSMDGSYWMLLGFPPADGEDSDWYVNPQLDYTGLILGMYPFEMTVNEEGARAVLQGQVIAEKSWEEMGYLWIAGFGVHMGCYPTPPDAFPADPDRLVGTYAGDLDSDGQTDTFCEIAGNGGVHQYGVDHFRSFSWLSLNSETVTESFADWLDEKVPGLPTDLIRELSLAFFSDIEAGIFAHGGPVSGYDAVGSGLFSYTVTAVETNTFVEESSWSRLKASY